MNLHCPAKLAYCSALQQFACYGFAVPPAASSFTVGCKTSDTAQDDEQLDAAATLTAAKPYAPLALTIATQYILIRLLCYSSRVPYC